MVSLVSRLRIVFVLMFLFVLGLPPVYAVDVDGLDFRVGVGSGVLEEQSYLDSSGEDDDVENVDGVENNSENNSDVVGGLENENSNIGLDSGVGLVSENNNNNNNFDGGSGLVTENNNNNDVVVGVDGFSGLGSVSGVPSVLGFSVSGDFDRSKTGVGFYRNVRVSVTGENFTGDNFLSKEGLHWSNKTRVEPITARKLGVINDPVRFFPQNTPNRPVTAYSMNNGDSGRITFVGKTQSNIDLDIIWTVTSSDRNAWISGSGFNNDGKTKGLGFTGQQYMPNSNGNSIVVLYNQANTLGLHYKIVKHGTDEEVPVLVSFISTDIDAGQGVDTDIDNITRIVPPESNLKIDGNLVYDSTPGVVGLNGSNDLPKGGYVGVGFVSSFNYTFFSPAPKRKTEYAYSSAVRYDIFGSSLQANVDSRIIQNLQVSYVTQDGMELSETRVTNGFVGDAITSEELTFDGYTLLEKKEDYSVSSYPKIVYVYKKDAKQVAPTKPNNPTTPNTPNTPNQPNNPTIPTKPSNPNTPTKPTNPSKPSNPTTQPVRPQTTTPPSTITRLPQTYVSRTLSPHTPPRQSQHLINKTTPKKQDKGPKVFVKKSRFGSIPIDDKTAVCNMFCKNTGMNKEQEKIFFKLLDDVASDAWEKPGATVESVNAEIAKVLAYHSYHDDPLEKQVIDFSTVNPKVHNVYNKKLLKKLHDFRQYPIDTPHQGATLGSSYTGSFYNEAVKYVGALAFPCSVVPLSCLPYLNVSPFVYNDVFWMLNSFVGDWLTHNSPKDQASNTDSYIMKYHPKYQGMTLNNIYRDLYRNYDMRAGARNELYAQAKGGIWSNIYHYGIIGLALSSLGAFGLTFIIPGLNKAFEAYEIGKKVFAVIRKEGITGVVKKGANIVRDKLVKPAINFVNNKVITPVKNFINNKVITPVKDFVKNKIITPVVKNIKKNVKVIKEKIVKPVTRFVKNKIVAPVKNFFNKIFKSSNTKTRPRKSSKNVKKGRRR